MSNAVKITKITKLLEDRVLIKPDEPVTRTKGGLVLPDTAVEKPRIGRVVAVGPGKKREFGGGGVPIYYYEAGNPQSLQDVQNAARNTVSQYPPIVSPSKSRVGAEYSGDRHPMTVAVGDRVLYTSSSGMFGGGGGNVEIDGEDFLLMLENEIICVISD